jgi:acyl carrier protein
VLTFVSGLSQNQLNLGTGLKMTTGCHNKAAINRPIAIAQRAKIFTTNAMVQYELKNVDSEDISELLIRVEASLNIKFGGDELIYIKTFGELCDHIANKVQLNHLNDCTSQQAFYKLRNAISLTLQIDNKTITTNSSLAQLFPKSNRRTGIKALEKHLGFKLNILEPPHWITGTLVLILLASFIDLLFDWKTGLPGLAFSIGGLWLSNKTGNVFTIETVGEAAGKMQRENYLRSRRNPMTFNKHEIEKMLIDWFSDAFDLDKSQLTREAKFV